MGCDIHMVVEAKVRDKWVCVDTMSGHAGAYPERAVYNWSTPVATARNYGRFAALAGVRGDGPEAKGFPDDASETAQYLYIQWEGDAHSASWTPLPLAGDIFKATDGGLSENDFAQKYPCSHFFNIEPEDMKRRDYRIVYWFDN